MRYGTQLFGTVVMWSVTLLPNVGASDTIVLMADEWCPYNCEPDSDSPGFMVEIAQEALSPYGHEVEYHNLNWARSLHKAETGEINGVIGAVPEEAPGFIFGPALGTYEDAIAFREGEAIDPDEISTRSDLRLGAINGYEYYGSVSRFIKEHEGDRSLVQYMSGDDALEKNLQKLVAGRLDIVAEVSSVLKYTLKEMGISEQVDLAHTDDVNDIFIAFSPALPNSELYAEQMTEGVLRLKETGRFDEIMHKYGQASE